MDFEPATGIMLDADGAPSCFTWRDEVFMAASRPVRWYSRALWWQDAEQAAAGEGQNLVETEMWRLWAASNAGRYFFQLRHRMPGDQWEVETATP